MLETKKLCAEVQSICKKALSGKITDISSSVRLALSESYSAIMRAHYSGMGGLIICRAHALCIDMIIEKLFDLFIMRRKKAAVNMSSKFCLIALGGYGRGELCPKSDIDIMFLYDNDVTLELKNSIVDEFLYPLWNTGLKLGHCSLTRREAMSDARSDIIFRNSLLDARFLCGSRKNFGLFSRSFKVMCTKKREEHFDELMRLKRDRHTKYNWTPYLQEPHIKNGIGGLRDAQTMRWKTYLNFGSHDLRELAKRRLISLSEYKSVTKAYDFLLRVRNDMHYLSGRENDLLDLETQVKVAQRLGYVNTESTVGVEEFMRKVYYSFRAIDSVSKAARKRMGIILPGDVLATMRHMGVRKPRNRKFTVDGFSIYRGEVNANWYNVFKSNPSRLIRVFSYCQEYGASPSDKLEIMIKDSRDLIDDDIRNDKKTNEIFLGILQKTGNVFGALEQMHFWGVLGRFIPEFGDITCMVQHEYYHRYTADMHILNTIAQLDKIFCARHNDGIYWEYHKVLTSTQNPSLAYLMMFLHDIGKADGIRGHSEVGAEIGAKLLDRLGVPPSDIETILFVVRNHLEMSRFWQTHDIEEEHAIAKFASMIGDEEQLKYLYVCTFCDAMGTSESFWNSYKQSLHSMLFSGTMALLSKEEEQLVRSYEKRKKAVMKEVLALPELVGKEDIMLEHMSNLPRNYFLFHGRGDLAMHVRMIDKLRNLKSSDSDKPILEWRDDPNRSITRLCVVSRDRSGFFAALSGVLSMSGMDILGSRIFTRPDGITIDTFYVTGIAGGLSENPNIRRRFSTMIISAIADENKLDSQISELFYSDKHAFGDSKSVDVFIRREAGKIILDIRAPDRVGLLYKLARAIFSCGYEINFARINTENGCAQDTFHVEPRPLAESLSELERSLKNIF